MTLVLYLAVMLAVALAVYGVWITAQTFGGDARVIARRLSRLQGAPTPDAQATDDNRLARIINERLPALKRRLLAARAPFTPTQVVLGSAGLFVGLLAVLMLAHLPWLLALAAAVWGGVAGPALLITWTATRRRKRFAAQMPQAVDLIARSLQAGHPVTTAIRVAAQQMPDPIGPELGLVMAEINFGLDRDAALRNLLLRFPIAELRMFIASLEVTRETGGNLAEVFLNLGEAMRAKAQLRKKVAAISAEGRMSFWVVSVLPLAVVAALMGLRPEYYREAASDPLFWPLMSVPPVLWLVGALTIWRMINFAI
ncbi:MAG: secretion system protein [Phenylobacterium sp.]|nr:secretion system protein [Phenylobacterium sp.]